MPKKTLHNDASPAAASALAAATAELRPGTAADAVAGITPAFVAAPASTAEAAAIMRAAAGHDLAVVFRGGGSRLHWGAPPGRCDLVLSTLGMGQVLEHAAGDLVARVQAGARMADVQAVLAAAGQEIALDVPGEATVGGVIADALAGPRRLRYGSPRDLLIGITIVRADGAVARSGGKVVKNVAGYDLGKLLAGSAGTLGLIAEATFRLHPLPAARAWVTAELPGSGDAGAAGTAAAEGIAAAVAAAANSPLVASAVELHKAGPGSPVSVSVLLEGSADGVAARAGRLAGLLPAPAVTGPAAPSWWRDWWGGVPAPGDGTLVRVTFWVSALGVVLDAIDAAAADASLRPVVRGSAGAGLLHVTLPADASASGIARFVSLVRAAVPAGRGGTVVLAAPEAVRAALASGGGTGSGGTGLGGTGLGGMAGEVPGAALMRAVKDQFDPEHRLAPGRLLR